MRAGGHSCFYFKNYYSDHVMSLNANNEVLCSTVILLCIALCMHVCMYMCVYVYMSVCVSVSVCVCGVYVYLQMQQIIIM